MLGCLLLVVVRCWSLVVVCRSLCAGCCVLVAGFCLVRYVLPAVAGYLLFLGAAFVVDVYCMLLVVLYVLFVVLCVVCGCVLFGVNR